MNRKLCFSVSVLILGLQGCAGTAQPQKSVSVSPSQQFEGGYINVTAPNSDGWQLIQSSGSGMGFGKRGPDAKESFGAQVLRFNLGPTNTPQEFEALLRKSAEKDTDPSRYVVQQMSFVYSTERTYPCVRYHSVVQDNAPQGLKGPLLLESDGLYCRHPVRHETGFAIIYSHRGEKLYASLRGEAESFIQGVQVPGRDGLPSLHTEETAQGVARIVDTSTGDDAEKTVDNPSIWKRLLLRRRGSGIPGGGFFFIQGIDGATESQNNMDASIRASSGQGRSMSFVKVEHPVSAGKHRIKLVGQYAYAAPIDSLFHSAANYRVEGELEVTLLPAVEYRVRGVLEEFRQEVWLEESATGKRIGEKLVNKTVEEARIRAMAGAGYACCNLHYDDEWISDENIWGLPFIPAGTPIAMREYGRNRIQVLVDGRPMTIGQDYGRKQETKEQLFAKLVVKEDPARVIASYSPAVQEAIRSGKVLLGMSKQQAIVSIGFPRADLTTSLDSPVWKYSTADDGDFELVWGAEGLLSEVRTEEPKAIAKILFSDH